jgi:hypothetical protein
MKGVIVLLLFFVAASCGATSLQPDFSSTEGFASTCGPLLQADPKKVKGDPERVAYFICGAVGLAKYAASWFRQNLLLLESNDPVARQRIRSRAENYLTRMSELRTVLEGVRGKGPYFVIQPGNWQIDFDGDGKVSLFEKYLFWVPRRGMQASPLDAPGSEDLYRSGYTSPVINVDQSDVYWAVAYVNFAEAALNVALAYDWDPVQYEETTLLDPRRISGSAYQRMLEGIRYSMRLRQSLLQETHDKNEWIANPRQADTSFPLHMDVQTFATWGSLLSELNSVLRGKTLLGGRIDSGERTQGMRDLSFGLCLPGEGLDVRALFVNPALRLFDPKQLAARCAKPTAARPLSGLATLVSASIKRNANVRGGAESGEWTVLRHLYWVN